MARPRFSVAPALALAEISAYHDDVAAALRLYFSSRSPMFVARFTGQSLAEVKNELERRLVESDIRSTLAVMTSLEAHFRTDFDNRCRGRFRDDLSRYFRDVQKTAGDFVRLDEDILEGWRMHGTAPSGLIGQVRGAFRFRHWLAHGRYWWPKLGQKYDFEGVYFMAGAIVSSFQFELEER